MDNLDKTISPKQKNISSQTDDVTMPGKRDRKPDGRFAAGDMIMRRYKVLAELGQGGMGVIYECFDETAGIEVALKALPPELSHNTLEMEDIRDNFQLIHNLHHPNIASVNNLERNESNGNYYLLMECCKGEDLRRWIKRKRQHGQLTLDDISPIIRQIAEALDYAHAEKIIHRDIKPGNIMISASGKVKVLDFGLAAQIHTSMTRISMAYRGTSGTGPYMAPEQWRGREQGAPADQYALAVMAYEMLAGHLPFESTEAAVLREAVLNDTPEKVADIPKTAQDAIMRAMSKDPAERFASCSDFAAALSGRKIKNAQIQKKNVFPKWAAGLIIAALLGAGAAGYCFFDKPLEEDIHLKQPVREQDKEGQPPQAAPEKKINKRLPKPAARQVSREPETELARQKRKNELQQENYRLQPQIKVKKNAIDAARLDRGQTFGRYLDTLAFNFAAAERAELNTDPEAANKYYKLANKAADWILKNAHLRIEVQKLFILSKKKKAEAEKFTAQKFAFVAYKAADRQVISARKDYDSGSFQTAAAALRSAIAGYEKAFTESRKVTFENLINSAILAQTNKQWDKVKELAGKIHAFDSSRAKRLISFADEQIELKIISKELDAARKAGSAGAWQKMRDHAVAALKINSSNPAAKALKREAENNLSPTLTITAYVNGKEVKAKVRSLKTAPDKTKYPWILKKGFEYAFEVTYRSGNAEYTGKIPSFTCTVNGPHHKKVSLAKVNFNGTVDLPEGVKLEMVKIKAGTFMMGSTEEEFGRDKDEEQHKVTLTKDYYLGKFEVTQAQYEALMGNNPSHFKGDRLPVESVTWDEAKAFCDKLNELYAEKLPSGYKFDLPTEAQWEYACRAGTNTIFSYGNSADVGKMNFDEKYFRGRNTQNIHGRQTLEVGSLGYKNAFGLYDMHGNVWEWCRDWHGSYTKDAIDPTGPSTGLLRVDRGGSWTEGAKSCRSAYRYSNSPGGRNNDLGFRLALVPIQ